MKNKFFEYLLKNRSIAIVFFGVLYIALSFTPFIGSHSTTVIRDNLTSMFFIAMLMSTLLAFALPVILFSYVHSKRSVDLYFALPVSRSKQLTTNICFAFIIAFGYFLITTLIGYILFGLSYINFLQFAVLQGYIAIYLLTLIIFNTLFFLVANNVFDGIVMIAAYCFIPILLYMTAISFVDTMVAGLEMIEFGDSLAAFASPIYMGFSTFIKLVSRMVTHETNKINVLYIIVPIILAILGSYGLYRHFVLRKTERAEQVSDELFAYPIVIHTYAILVLLMLGFNTVRFGMGFTLPLYLVLLFIYIVATFVYRRKIQVNWKNLAFFGIGMALSLVIANGAWLTEGFGVSRNYPLDGKKYLIYSGLVNGYGSEIGGVNISYTVEIPIDKKDEYKEIIDFFEEKRQKAITKYYDTNKASTYVSDSTYYGELLVELTDTPNSYDPKRKTYYYTYAESLTINEMKLIDKYGEVNVSGEKTDYEEVPLEEYLEEEGK